MKKSRWLTAAAKGTDIHWAKSQAEIARQLTELGMSAIRFTNQRDRFALEFVVTLPDREQPRAVRISVPLRTRSEDGNQREREANRLHRVLFHHLQSKFVAIAAGLSDFDEEFMPHLVLPDQHGHSRTLGEALLPAYRQAIDRGDKPAFQLWGEGRP
jgi:hypothetical protein